MLGFHGKLLLTLTQETRKKIMEGKLSNTLLTVCKGTVTNQAQGRESTGHISRMMSYPLFLPKAEAELWQACLTASAHKHRPGSSYRRHSIGATPWAPSRGSDSGVCVSHPPPEFEHHKDVSPALNTMYL